MLFVLQWLTPYAIVPALAGIAFGVFVKTPRARLAFALVFLASATALAAVRMDYLV